MNCSAETWPGVTLEGIFKYLVETLGTYTKEQPKT